MSRMRGLEVVTLVLVLGAAREARAHCDTMDGPVVTAAKQALSSGNASHALIWVQPGDEGAIREALALARAERAAGGGAREKADRRFFETLVRIHRAGEGAAYTGVKPQGTAVGPAVTAADRSLAAGSVEPVRAVLAGAVQSGIERHYRAVMDRKSYSTDDVAAGRAYVKAYVEYTHFAEGLYDKATSAAGHHDHAAGRGAGHQGGAGAHAGHSGHAAHLAWLVAIALGLALAIETGWILRRRRPSVRDVDGLAVRAPCQPRRRGALASALATPPPGSTLSLENSDTP